MYKLGFYNFKAILPDWSPADYPELVFDRLGDASKAAEKLLYRFADRAEGQECVTNIVAWSDDDTEKRHYTGHYTSMGAAYNPREEFGELIVEEEIFDEQGTRVQRRLLSAYVWVEEELSSPYEF